MIKKILAIVALMYSFSASAFPAYSDFAFIDKGTYSTDVYNGIDFLHLSQTVGYSYNDIVVNDVIGYMADGWSLTKKSELDAIFFPHTFTIESSLYQIAGSAGDHRIIIDSEEWGGNHELDENGELLLWISYMPCYSGRCWLEPDPVGQLSANFAWSGLAVSLSRHSPSPVPEPATAWLLVSGLIILAGAARRKNNFYIE